jgi:hypothetical protein
MTSCYNDGIIWSLSSSFLLLAPDNSIRKELYQTNHHRSVLFQKSTKKKENDDKTSFDLMAINSSNSSLSLLPQYYGGDVRNNPSMRMTH